MPLTYRIIDRPRRGAVITGFDGPARFLDIPSEIGGERVLDIADHAFSDRKDLVEVRIREGVGGIGRYAFYNCIDLRKLVLTDSVDGCGDGALRRCPDLREIEIAMNRGYYRLVKDLVDDTDEELTLTLSFPDGTRARLTFPGYFSEIREDFEARMIHQSIRGAGFTYRQCVTRRGIDYEAYDAGFDRAVNAGLVTAGVIAISRLLCPVGLTEKARGQYEHFLKENAQATLIDRIEAGDDESVRLLAGLKLAEEALQAGIARASALQETEICGILMEAVRREEPVGGVMMFDFDDL